MGVKLGYLENIENTDRPVFSHANKSYIAGLLASHDGSIKRYLMFTDNEINKGSDIEVVGLKLELGRVYPITQGWRKSYIIRCYVNGVERTLKLSECKLCSAYYRSRRNPEDQQEQEFWDGIFH